VRKWRKSAAYGNENGIGNGLWRRNGLGSVTVISIQCLAKADGKYSAETENK
jgi:hypothetical protein